MSAWLLLRSLLIAHILREVISSPAGDSLLVETIVATMFSVIITEVYNHTRPDAKERAQERVRYSWWRRKMMREKLAWEERKKKRGKKRRQKRSVLNLVVCRSNTSPGALHHRCLAPLHACFAPEEINISPTQHLFCYGAYVCLYQLRWAHQKLGKPMTERARRWAANNPPPKRTPIVERDPDFPPRPPPPPPLMPATVLPNLGRPILPRMPPGMPTANMLPPAGCTPFQLGNLQLTPQTDPWAQQSLMVAAMMQQQRQQQTTMQLQMAEFSTAVVSGLNQLGGLMQHMASAPAGKHDFCMCCVALVGSQLTL